MESRSLIVVLVVVGVVASSCSRRGTVDSTMSVAAAAVAFPSKFLAA